MEMQWTKIAKIFLKENNDRRRTLSDIKSYFKTILTKTV